MPPYPRVIGNRSRAECCHRGPYPFPVTLHNAHLSCDFFSFNNANTRTEHQFHRHSKHTPRAANLSTRILSTTHTKHKRHKTRILIPEVHPIRLSLVFALFTETYDPYHLPIKHHTLRRKSIPSNHTSQISPKSGNRNRLKKNPFLISSCTKLGAIIPAA